MKSIIATLCALTAAAAFAAPVMLNPDFDKPLPTEARFDFSPGVLTYSQYTENLTWNKCLRMEAVAYKKNKDGSDSFYASVLLGANNKNPGFMVKPNTVYKFKLELKGTMPGKHIGMYAIELTGNDFWKNSKALKVKDVGKIEISPEKWAVYTGTFQTSAHAKSVMFGLSIWGESKYKNLPPLKSFVLIDKLKIEEMADLLGNAEQVTAKKSVPQTVVAAGEKQGNFTDYMNGTPAKAATSFTVNFTEKSIVLNITCQEPAMDKLHRSVSADNANPWQDDCLEIFFAPLSSERALTQFVVASGGGRWMAYGANKQEKNVSGWSVKNSYGPDEWTSCVEIPYSLIGWSGKPFLGSQINFNIARQRKPERELTSWSQVMGSFHDVSKFGVMVLGDSAQWRSNAIAELTKEIAKVPTGETKDKLTSELIAWSKKNQPLREAVAEKADWESRIKYAILGKRTFVLTCVPATIDPTLPLLPDTIANPPQKIVLDAAVNDVKPLPLALTNLQKDVEEYQITIGTPAKATIHQPGLRSVDGKVFPHEKIKMLRAVRVKDGDGKRFGKRFDPLVVMDKTQTVMVPGCESGLVWVLFDTAGVAPGKYAGTIRIVPLSGESEFNHSTVVYTGPMIDLPLEFEVLPFELAKEPVIPSFYFNGAINEEFFKFMTEYGIDRQLINPWAVNATFNLDGSLKSSDTSSADKTIADYKLWAKKYGNQDRLKIGVVYSAYVIFSKVWAQNKFKAGTPEWKRAWQNYVRLFDNMFKKHGISNKDYFVEIWDEPHEKDVEELAMACQAAYEAVPEMRQMVVFASWAIPANKLKKLAPYVQIWNFWDQRFIGNKDYDAFISDLRKAKKDIAFYNCEISMRLDLQKYYRRHAWFGLANNLEMLSLYQLIDGAQGTCGAPNWKSSAHGGIVYKAHDGSPVSSIRMENMRLGTMDIKYMKALEDAVAKAEKSGKSATLIAEAKSFLQSEPRKVAIDYGHDYRQAEAARAKCAALILKLNK